MHALRVESLTADLSGVHLVDVPVPPRGPGEVLVRVRAASLNFPDLLMTRGEYQLRPDLPFVSGLEFAGEVVEADADSGLSPGDKVYGGNKTGAFAEYAVVPARAISPMPHGIGFPAAAALGAAYGTAYTALVEIGGLKAGQWVLVHGASGGVGLAAVELAKRLGAHVIATTGSPDKVERLRAASDADAVIPATGRFREAVADLTGGALCDLVYDPVGGRIADISTNIPLIKGFSIVGVRAGEYARRFPERGRAIREAVATLAADGRLNPHIDRTLPLSRWREAFDAMARREIVGKIVLEP